MNGILRTFETVIALTLVMLTFITLYTGQDPLPEFDTVSWKMTGMENLRSLDFSNNLRYDALTNDTAAIENALLQNLPPIVDVIVQVCQTNCSSPTINAEKSTSVHYLISGMPNNSTPSEIILYIYSNE